MLDLLHLPKPTPSNVDYFYNTGGVSSWVTWEKPRGIIMLEIICIGAGGGGRSGWCANSTTRSGGGGGASGCFSKLLIPAVFLPDVLYVQVGAGGRGGASTTSSGTANVGFGGAFSAVSIAPSSAAFYTVCFANGGGGAPSGTSSAGNGGSAQPAATQANALMSGLGQLIAFAAQLGATGNTGAAGISLTYPTNGLLLSGGAAGGGGVSSGGGSIIVPSQPSFLLFDTRIGGASFTNNGPGADGLFLSQPLLSTGGAGGSASNSTVSFGGSGGRGGNGGFGSGGGGGGVGPTGSGGGAGGNGGDGLVIIRSW